MAGRQFSLIVGYGTDMGNAEDAAMTLTELLGTAGIEAEAIELNQIDVGDLQTATHFVVVTSTFGDGEFPDNATLFWEAISGETERLEHLSFAVLALGDSSYDLFCNAGKLLDERLEELGATRLTERVDIDGFYEEPAKAWSTDVVKLLAAEQSGSTPTAVVTVIEDTEPTSTRERNHPVDVRLVVNRRLTADASDKEVRHYELDLANTGITYTAGDSIAVHATNDPVLVEAVLAQLGVGADYPVVGHDEPLGVLLTNSLEIRTPSRALKALVASRTNDEQAIAALNSDGATVPGSWL